MIFIKTPKEQAFINSPPFLGYPKVWGTTTQCTTNKTSVGVVSPRGVAPPGGRPTPPLHGEGGGSCA